MKYRNKLTFVIIVLITALLSFVAAYGIEIGDINIKGANHMRYGIDIRGGVEATYEPKDLNRSPTADELESAKSIIETRMDADNITDREIYIDNTRGTILVRFPWKSGETSFDPQKAVTELGETALLTFRDPNGDIVLQGSDIKKSYAQLGTGSDTATANKPLVILELSSEGRAKFAEATAKLVKQKISIYMDENLIESPTVNEKIDSDTAQIEDIGTMEQAKALANKINSGALPFSLTAKNCNIISPTIGTGALSVMVKAGVLAFILVCIFMLVYYRLLGFVACIALVLQVVGQLLALSVPQFTLTLPGIAGVILSIGMGVDANVISSERIKEELKTGKTLNAAISAGYQRAFSSVFDGNITVIIVAIILILLGSGSILSFGYTLLCGVIMNFVAGVTSSRLMTWSLSSYSFLRNPKFYGARRAA